MASSYLSAPTPREARRRTASLVLAVAAHLLVIWLLFHLSPALTTSNRDQRPLTTFDLDREAGSKPKAEAKQKPRTLARQKSRSAAAAAQARPAPTEATTPPPPTPPTKSLFGDKSLFAAGDIGKMPSDKAAGEVADSGAGNGRGSGAVYGPGAGPGGSKLYNVAWVREPTDAELSGYLTKGVPPGAKADIACRMIAGNQVDNCRSLGESPPGYDLARALRLAAWQFRIYPPRVDNKPLIGVWVRIHFDFVKKGGDEDK